MPRRLARYLFRLHAARVVQVMALVLFVVWLGQFADQARHISTSGLAGLGRALLATLMRSPALVPDVLPHVVLVGSALAMHGLVRRFELPVILMTGRSLGQVLLPMALSGFVLGLGYLVIIDPAAAWLNDLSGPLSGASATGSRRVAHEASLPLKGGGTVLVFARDVLPDQARAAGISIFILDASHALAGRIEASAADMSRRPWQLTDAQVQRLAPAARGPGAEGFAALVTIGDGTATALDLPTQTLLAEVRDASRLPLWALPGAIASARQLGRPGGDFDRALQRRLALPALLAAITLVGGALATGRTGKEPWLRLVAQLLIAAFLLYTVLTVCDAMAARQRLSAMVAAALPVLACGGAGLLVMAWKRL